MHKIRGQAEDVGFEWGEEGQEEELLGGQEGVGVRFLLVGGLVYVEGEGVEGGQVQYVERQDILDGC